MDLVGTGFGHRGDILGRRRFGVTIQSLTIGRAQSGLASSEDDDLDEVRAELLRLTVLLGVVTTMALVALLVSEQHLERWFAPLVLGSTVLGAYVVLPRSRPVAAWILCLGAAATALGSVAVYDAGYAVCGLGLLV